MYLDPKCIIAIAHLFRVFFCKTIKTCRLFGECGQVGVLPGHGGRCWWKEEGYIVGLLHIAELSGV